MGDRRMAQIKTSNGSLYVYTHWHGYDWEDATRQAIVASESRWGDFSLADESYALRVIVDQLTIPGRDDSTGYGLAFSPSFEDEYYGDKPSIVIDIPQLLLTFLSNDNPTQTFTFDEVVASESP